jgi:cell division protein FtsI/penicillin-binding protein 2
MTSPGEQARPRIFLVIIVMGFVALALVVQMVRVQFGPFAPVFAEREQSQRGLIERISPSRGLIYDRNGVLLTANKTIYHIEVDIPQLTATSKREIAITLSQLLSLPEEDLFEQLSYDWASQGLYRVRLTYENEPEARWPITIDQVMADVLEDLSRRQDGPDLSGMWLVPEQRRVYPSGSLAGHVLGFVNDEGKGFFGVEGYYDEWLAGKPITVERPLIPIEARLQPDPPAGVNLVLTIDIEVQYMVEQILADAIEWSHAESGQIIVMDPRNGEMFAIAAWPPLDPNDYESWLQDDDGGSKVINPASAGVYEPGSTLKVLTMSAAIDAGMVQPDDVFVDTGEIEVGGHKIRNWDGEAWGPQTMVGCLQHSLNVCLAYVAAEKLGAGKMYPYFEDFGLGQLTGIDLAGEIEGQLRTPRHPQWTESDLGTNSFGQGVSVTPIQLISAVAALANDGVMVQPHVVRQVVSPRGVYSPGETVLGRPVTPETAHVLTRMLSESVDEETRFAEVAGYELAGKTGTAQIPTDFGYDPYKTVASFIGWGTVADPRFIVLVRLDKPTISPWGSVVAAPVFQKVVERLVVMMEIPPDDAVQQLASVNRGD